MKLAIMQPYFLPYIGYFQMMNAVDNFIIYDNIEFSKNGWVQRNRILLERREHLFSLPLRKDSDFLNINERFLADIYPKERDKTLRVIRSAYGKAPYYSKAMPILEDCFNYDNMNLFEFIFHSLNKIKEYLGIKTAIIVSSGIGIEKGLSGTDRVLALCKAIKCKQYINAIGGQKLYDKEDFSRHGIDLYFIKTGNFSYPQLGNDFIPNLSIIDLMMFNSKKEIQKLLDNYSLV